MGNNYIPKCKNCKGAGIIKKTDPIVEEVCPMCSGTGRKLHNSIDETLNDYLEATDDKIYPDQDGFINLEEEDYKI